MALICSRSDTRADSAGRLVCEIDHTDLREASCKLSLARGMYGKYEQCMANTKQVILERIAGCHADGR